MKLSGWILTSALLVPLALSGQNGTQANAGTSNPAQPKLSLQGEHFLTVLANEDASEIELANLALKKSGNAQVQQYAKTKILAADPAMEQGAQNIQKQNNAPPSGLPTPSDKAEYYYLSKLSGQDFDMAYMDYEDAKQQEDLILVQNAAAAAKDPQIKQYAAKEETPVREAADAAKRIAQALGL